MLQDFIQVTFGFGFGLQHCRSYRRGLRLRRLNGRRGVRFRWVRWFILKVRARKMMIWGFPKIGVPQIGYSVGTMI